METGDQRQLKAHSERVKDCFARRPLRTHMKRRYFVGFPVGVWPPGAAPSSACLNSYKLAAEVSRRCCWMQGEGNVWKLHWDVFLLACVCATSKNTPLQTKAGYRKPDHTRGSVPYEVLQQQRGPCFSNFLMYPHSMKLCHLCVFVCAALALQCGQISSLLTHSHLELIYWTQDG